MQILAGSFVLLILAGAGLLMLPECHAPGQTITFLDALFTSTSAVCVTGLIVVDTATAWTRTGQVVILLLIQFGGIGIISFGALFAMLLGQRISFRQRQLLKEQFGEFTIVNILDIIPVVTLLTLAIELLGTIILLPRFVPQYGIAVGLWHAVFHSISAFCNAGFSTFSTNLEGFKGDALVNLDICSLIVLGGLGFPVLAEILERKGNRKRLSLHTRVVLLTTATLIVAGALFLFIIETGFSSEFRDLPLGSRILASLFQSVTARTAGFNTIPIGRMAQASQLLLVFLMFIGGSPSGTAGGIKTTTFVVSIAAIWSVLNQRTEVNLLGRRLERNNVRRALVLVVLAAIILSVGLLFLLIFGSGNLMELLLELVSAFGTVGLSTGITSSLTAGQRIVIILTMFVGRLGPMTFALALARPRAEQVRFPETNLLTG